MKAEYISHHGDDLLVVNAARVSFDKVSHTFTDKDERLIHYLARGMSESEWRKVIADISTGCAVEGVENLVSSLMNMAQHWAPFSHPHITLRMQAPVPIRTQCFKHKIGFMESEESRRYISSKPEVYVPDVFRMKSSSAKQGSGDPHPDSDILINGYMNITKIAIDGYQILLEEGVCPEQARLILPQGCEVNWIWTGSLAAYARFYNQRTDAHAQREVQMLAEEVGSIIAPLFPVSWKALTGGQKTEEEKKSDSSGLEEFQTEAGC